VFRGTPADVAATRQHEAKNAAAEALHSGGAC